jgi:hypothetical protein
VEIYLHSPSVPAWRGAHLKYRDNVTFYLYRIMSELLVPFNISGQTQISPTGLKSTVHELWIAYSDIINFMRGLFSEEFNMAKHDISFPMT